MSDNILAALIAAVAACFLAVIQLLSAAFVAWMQMRSADKAATKVAEVKTTLEAKTEVTDGKLKDLAGTLGVVHALVNNDMHVALQAVADLARFKANTTGLPVDEATAQMAEKALKAHDTKQIGADAMKKGDG